MGVYVDTECCSAWDSCGIELARLIDPSAEASHKREQSQGFISRWYQALAGADRIIAAGYVKVTDDAEMLERVAQAIHEHNRDWCPPYWEQLTEGARDDYRKEARAALRAVSLGLYDDDRVIVCHVIEDEEAQDECITGDMS